MKKLLLVCTLFAAAELVCAEAVAFRSGAILCAELSTVKPSGFKRLDTGEAPKDPIYAAITVKLDPGRKISIFDYSLRIGNRRYECSAVRNNGEDEISVTSDGGEKRRCTLFFELDAATAKRGGKCILVCNAPGGGETGFKLTDRGGKRFTPDSAIPEPDSGEPEK